MNLSPHFSFVQSTTWEPRPYCTALLQTKKCLMETSAMRQASYKHGSTRMPVKSRRRRTMLTRQRDTGTEVPWRNHCEPNDFRQQKLMNYDKNISSL